MTQRSIPKARALYPAIVTLPSPLLPRGEMRRLDEARWAEREAADAAGLGGDDGVDLVQGGSGAGKLLPAGYPDVPWNESADHHSAEPAKLPYDIASLDGARPDRQIEPEMGGLMSGRLADGVTYSPWPVPGDGKPAMKRVVGPNGHTYSDGSYAPNGGTRGFDKKGKIIRHMGIDLPAKIGTNVAAVDDGVVTLGTQWSKDDAGKKAGWGDYVDIRYSDGTIGKYAHLKPEGRPANGTHVKRGETIGIVGNTGNAAAKGDHLHYEVRLPNGRRIDPSASIRQRRVYVYPRE